VCALLGLLGTVFPPRGIVDMSVSTVLLVVTVSVVLVALKKVEVGLLTHRECAAPAGTVSTYQFNQSYAIEMHATDSGRLHLLLIPELCPGGPRLTCGQTLSTNQMRPWD